MPPSASKVVTGEFALVVQEAGDVTFDHVWFRYGDDAWTLIAEPAALCVQYEHTIVATKRGAIVVTL